MSVAPNWASVLQTATASIQRVPLNAEVSGVELVIISEYTCIGYWKGMTTSIQKVSENGENSNHNFPEG